MPPSLSMGEKRGGGHRCRGDRSQVPKDRGTKTGRPGETGAEDGGQGAGQELGVDGPAAHGSESNRRGQCPGERPRLGALRSAERQGAPDPGNVGGSLFPFGALALCCCTGAFSSCGERGFSCG